MSEQDGAARRPSQVTTAGWVAIVGSALLVVTLFESMAQLRSVERREALQEFLSRPPYEELGLSVDRALEIIRGLTLFGGAVAAVTLVLGIYVMQRSKGARLGFTIAAVGVLATAPLATAPVAGGFLPVLIALAATLLWTAPARAWYSGRPQPAPAPARDRAPGQEGSLMSSDDPGTSGNRPHPPPSPGYGNPPGSQPEAYPGGQPPPYGQDPYASPQPGSGQPGYPDQQGYPPSYQQSYPPYGGYQQYTGYPQYGGYPPQRDPAKRPGTVTAAVWITWVFCSLTLLGVVAVVLFLAVGREEFLREVRRDADFRELDFAASDLLTAMWVGVAILAFWCVAGIVLAAFAYRGANWARIMLVVSASITALLALISIFSLVSALHLLAAGAVIVLLFSGGANQWYSSRGGLHGAHPTYPPYGQGYGGQGYGGQGYAAPPPPTHEDKDPPKNVW